jgi:hypothetical protein
MGEPFIGSEAIASGDMARSTLRSQYTKVFHDVYVSAGTELTPPVRARAAWLWSRRRGIIAGLSAAALHGARWIDPATPVEIIHSSRNSLTGLRVRGDRIDDDEIDDVAGVPVTTPARTALDLACWYPTGEAVAAIDALARATGLAMADVEALEARYQGRRSIRWARTALSLIDAGATSPEQTWLRLQVVKAGLPTPRTQIPVRDESGDTIAYLDMGWPDVKVAVEYDGDQQRTDRGQFSGSIRRLDTLGRLGWVVVRVGAGEQPAEILHRVRAALVRRSSQLHGRQRRASR